MFQSKKYLPYSIALVGVLISSFLLFNTLDVKEKNRDSEFKASVESVFSSIEKGFKEHLAQIGVMKDFYAASQYVDESEFYQMSASFMQNSVAHEVIGFIPAPNALRHDMRLAYVSPSHFKRRGTSYGFETNSSFLNAMKDSQETGALRGVFAAPHFVKKTQDDTNTYMSFFQTVTGEGGFLGFLFSVLNMEYLLGSMKEKNVDFSIIDMPPHKEAHMIYATALPKEDNSLSEERRLNIAGHHFLIQFTPTDLFLHTYNYNEAWFVFLICIAISLMVAIYVQSSQKYMDKLIRAQQETEQANALQRDFLATMSHEIRTPMNAIIGMGDLLLDEGLEVHHAQRVKTIVSAGEGLLQILNDILDFSKIEAGKLDMEEISFSPAEIVEDVADLHALQAQNKGVELTVWQNSIIPDLVIGDQGRVRQILNNLVGNAIKFTHTGHILIQIELLEKNAQNEAVLKFGVKDTGVGIPEEVQDLVFDRFRQADSSTTRQFGGTGLGLAICKKLTEIMRGDVGLESKEGEGSHFWFTATLPIDETAHKKIDTNIDLGQASIVVVDDIEINLEILNSYLHRWNANATLFSDPQEAWNDIVHKNASDTPYDVILTDHLMPDTSGVKLMQNIRNRIDLKQSPAILISSYMDSYSSNAVREMEDVYHLSKPIHPERLKSMILKILGRYGEEEREKYTATNARAAIDTQNIQFSDVRVLVAEDNHANQEIAEKILERMGCSVTCVGNGAEAVEIISTLPFDIVFMDCQMPEMDGFEATGLIRELISQGEIKETPIVALTANAMKGDKKRCLEAGMQDYISKPVKKNAFKDVLARWLPEKVNKAQEEGGQEKEALSTPDSQEAELKTYSDPVFDEDVYGELKEMIGDESAHSILMKYTGSTREDQKVIPQNFEKRDYKSVSEYAHKLKSASAQIGAVRLSRVSAEIESYFKQDGDFDKMVSYVDEYKNVLDDTLAELEKRVHSSG